MIYNDSLPKSYGLFNELTAGSEISRTRPQPSNDDYASSFITRYFAKKVNEDLTIEISYENSIHANTALYKVVSLKWRISGPKHNVIKAGIIDKAGVVEQNAFEIDRVKKETGVDLISVLSNPLEFWLGR